MVTIATHISSRCNSTSNHAHILLPFAHYMTDTWQIYIIMNIQSIYGHWENIFVLISQLLTLIFIYRITIQTSFMLNLVMNLSINLSVIQVFLKTCTPTSKQGLFKEDING